MPHTHVHNCLHCLTIEQFFNHIPIVVFKLSVVNYNHVNGEPHALCMTYLKKKPNGVHLYLLLCCLKIVNINLRLYIVFFCCHQSGIELYIHFV
jgi:hypothetical protein